MKICYLGFAIMLPISVQLGAWSDHGENTNSTDIDVFEQLRKTIVFLGKIEDTEGEKKPRYIATGFLVSIEGKTHLVTAKHIVMEVKNGKFTGRLIDQGMFAYYNMKRGGIAARPLKIVKEKFDIDWIFHEDQEVDVAVMPFGLDVKKDDVRTIPDNLFLSADSLVELYELFFLSYQPGIEPKGSISPVMRTGTLSLNNKDGSFYIDAAAFPGNSGSPVFLKPSPVRYTREKGWNIGKDPLGLRFIGIIGEYVPYREVALSAQTLRPRVIFEENTGLSKVWSVSFLNEIVSSKAFKDQLERLKGNE